MQRNTDTTLLKKILRQRQIRTQQISIRRKRGEAAVPGTCMIERDGGNIAEHDDPIGIPRRPRCLKTEAAPAGNIDDDRVWSFVGPGIRKRHQAAMPELQIDYALKHAVDDRNVPYEGGSISPNNSASADSARMLMGVVFVVGFMHSCSRLRAEIGTW